MSWSLQLRDGDLSVQGARLGQVDGRQKVLQDLSCAILERMGTDDLHPWFGSLIDGGYENGIERASLIAVDNWDYAVTTIEADIRRIIKQHQQMQIQRTEDDRMKFGRPTITPDEVIENVNSIHFYAAQDTLLVRVDLNVNGQSQKINLPLGGS